MILFLFNPITQAALLACTNLFILLICFNFSLICIAIFFIIILFIINFIDFLLYFFVIFFISSLDKNLHQHAPHSTYGSLLADIVKTLLAHEACDVTSKDSSGITPKELASQMGVSLSLPSKINRKDNGSTLKDGDQEEREKDNGDGNDQGKAKLRQTVFNLERELVEQKNLVAGLRDMLNTILSENGVQTVVTTLQSELQRVKEEGRLLAESSFRKLKTQRDEKIERMCSAYITKENGNTEDSEGSTFDYFMSILGLQDDEDDYEDD